MTTPGIEPLRDFAENEMHGADLRGYAARDAVRVLLDNWEDALRDGSTDNLVSDIDGVIERLRTFQEKAKQQLPAQNGGAA